MCYINCKHESRDGSCPYVGHHAGYPCVVERQERDDRYDELIARCEVEFDRACRDRMAADERAGEALEQIKQFQAEKREVWA